MASSLGYALMNWASEFTKHSKKKRKKALSPEDDHGGCPRCEEASARLIDCQAKLWAKEGAMDEALNRESKIVESHGALEVDRTQIHQELADLRAVLSKRLKENDLRVHLSQTLDGALEDNELEQASLTSLGKEVASLQAVVQMRAKENRELRTENGLLRVKLEEQLRLEAELGKARQRLEELSLVVKNKADSERELLELSELLQQDLARCRNEALRYKQQLENQNYLQLASQLGLGDNVKQEDNNNRWVEGSKEPTADPQLQHHRNQHQKLW